MERRTLVKMTEILAHYNAVLDSWRRTHILETCFYCCKDLNDVSLSQLETDTEALYNTHTQVAMIAQDSITLESQLGMR